MKFPFVGGSYRARSSFVDSARTVNLYPEISNKTGTSKAIAALYGTPGTVLWLNLPGGAVRGMHRFKKDLSVIIVGNQVYQVKSDKTYEVVGTIDAAATPANMANNGTVVMIVTGQNGYFLNPTTKVLTPISDPDFVGADTVQFIDGYFCWNKPDTGQFQISQLYGETIDGLDFATAEGSPDNLLSLLVDHREIWLFGETTTEVFFNTGDSLFPFGRIEGGFIQQGCAAKFSPVRMDNSVYWLAADEEGFGTVQKAVGYQPQRVSTHALEFAIKSYERVDDAVGYAYQQEGHNFYMLTFPTANVTWCYDSKTEEWHERVWRSPVDGSWNRHRSNAHMAFSGKNLVSDWENGNIYYLDLDTYTDNGDILPAVRQTPYSYADGRWMFFSTIWLDMEVGVGLEDGSDPQVMLDWSDDGGKTFENEITGTLGKIGERNTRLTFSRLGKSQGRVWKVTVTDPVKRAFLGADWEMSVGRF